MIPHHSNPHLLSQETETVSRSQLIDSNDDEPERYNDEDLPMLVESLEDAIRATLKLPEPIPSQTELSDAAPANPRRKRARREGGSEIPRTSTLVTFARILTP